MSDDTYLIKAADIAALEGLKKVHFLNSNAQRVNKSLGDLTGITGFGFHIIEVAPGFETTEFHMHHNEDECVYVLEGKASAEIGDEKLEIGPGDFIGYRKGGLAHTIRNTGDQTLRCVVVGQRLDQDIGDYPRLEKRLYRSSGKDWDLVDRKNITNPKGAGGK